MSQNKKSKLIGEPKLFAVFLTSFFVLILAAILGILAPNTVWWLLCIIVLAQLSSSVFFPLIVGFFSEKFKQRLEGETIWEVFKEFSDGGILRVYKDREEGPSKENAHVDLREAFENHQAGVIKLAGVSLRVFFNQTGPFYRSITKICTLFRQNQKVSIRALVNHLDSPEVMNRSRIETPDRLEDPLIKIDIKFTVASIENLNKNYGDGSVEFGYYKSAPYCTAIIFPDKCYFSPNILSIDPPVRLPMIVFRAGSHGYLKINAYFDYLWEQKKIYGKDI